MAKYDSAYPELRTLPKMIAFLEEKLSETEVKRIEQIIEEDELYAYALERLHQAMLNGEDVASVASQYQDVFIETIRKQPESLKMIFPVWARYMAAAVVIIGVISFLFFSQSTTDISEMGFSPYESRLGLKGNNDIESLSAFMLAYQNQDYTEAIDIGNQLLGTEESLSTNQVNELYLCLGYSYLDLGNQSAAIDILKRALEAPEPRLRTEARWYLAMAYIKEEDMIQARKYLEAIQSSDAGKTRLKEAQELLNLLP